MKQYNNFNDLIAFTRASSGTALRPISYGDELVENGDFSEGTTGWVDISAGTGTFSVVSEQAQITRIDGGNLGWAYQNIDTTVGKIYFATVTEVADGAAFRIGTTNGGGEIYDQGLKSGLNTISFVATSSATSVSLRGAANGSTALIDNISVREVLFDQPDGTLTLFNHPTNVPRIEYDSDGNRLGLLVEESRSNLVTYSEDFTNAAWIEDGATVTASTTTAPDGLASSYELVENSSSATQHRIVDSIPISSGVTYTASVYVKRGTGSRQLGIINVLGGSRVYFNLDTNTVDTETLGSGKIESVGNGWYRCSATGVSTSTSTAFYIALCDGITAGSETYDGDGSSSILIYGAQFEAGSFPTSYIPSNSGSTTTRSADVASIGVSEFGYNQKAGTLFVEFDMKYTESGSGFPRVVEIATESNNADRIKVQLTESTGALNAQAFVNFSVQGGINLGNRTGGSLDSTKVAFAFREDDFAASDNGNTAVTDTSGTFAPSVGRDTLAIGKQTNSSNNFVNGHIKSIKYYPRRLTNSQLVEITS